MTEIPLCASLVKMGITTARGIAMNARTHARFALPPHLVLHVVQDLISILPVDVNPNLQTVWMWMSLEGAPNASMGIWQVMAVASLAPQLLIMYVIFYCRCITVSDTVPVIMPCWSSSPTSKFCSHF